MTELFAEVNGTKICYEIFGEGYPVVLVHGFGATKESWLAQVPDLSNHFKIIRFDNRGAGNSDRSESSYKLGDYVEDIKGLLDQLRISKAHIIGWSLGGMLVQNYALKYPETVNKLVLINTNYGTPDESGPEAYKNMQIQRAELRKEDPAKVFWSGIRTGFYIKFRKQMEKEPSKKWYGLWSAEDLIEQSTINPATVQEIELQGDVLKEHNTAEMLNKITNSTLLLTASHDRITPRSTMEEIHKKMLKSTIHVIENAGHNSPLEKAPEVNQLIIDFLNN